MSATRKKQPITSKRVRMSEIIEEMTELSNAFAILRGSDDDLTTTIDEAIADVRAMIGDELTDDDEWIVAARPEQTRAELDLEKHRLRVERNSGPRRAAGEQR